MDTLIPVTRSSFGVVGRILVLAAVLGCGAEPVTTGRGTQTEELIAVAIEFDGQESAPLGSRGSPDVEQPLTAAEIAHIRQAIVRCGGFLRCDEYGQPAEVDLVGGRASADGEALEAAMACPNLRILRARVGRLASQQLARIQLLTRLEELMLQDTAIDDTTLTKVVASLPGLRRLTLRNAHEITEHGIAELTRGSGLTQLALIDMQITGQAVTHIANMPCLGSLDLRMCQVITGKELAALVAAPQLRELKLGAQSIDNAALAVVATLPHLESLAIEDAAIDGLGLARFAAAAEAAKRMRSLAFARCPALADDGLRCLKSFRNLRHLTLRDMPITGTFLEAIRGMDQLELLSLNQTFLVDEAFDAIANFQSLKRLELAQNILSLGAMENVASLSDLEYLNLTDCVLHADLLEPLTNLQKLRTLVVDGNPDVSREAVAKLLSQHERE